MSGQDLSAMSDDDLAAAYEAAQRKADNLESLADIAERELNEAREAFEVADKHAEALQEEVNKRRVAKLREREAALFGHAGAEALATQSRWRPAGYRVAPVDDGGRAWYGNSAILFRLRTPDESRLADGIASAFPKAIAEASGEALDVDAMPEAWTFAAAFVAFARTRCDRVTAILSGDGPILQGFDANGDLELLAMGRRLP